MDLAKTLIRSVARAFYETKHVLVVDALMVHSALPNEDLALLLGMQQKDLRKLCGKLKEDRLLAVHSRQETREGQQRPINKDYYYIDFHATIDAIKYRVYHLTERVKNLYKPSEEKQDYHCPRCKSAYTTLQVLDSVGPEGFICHRCGAILEEENRTGGDLSGHEKQSKLMGQLERLLKLLQQIDSEDIPNNDFDSAFAVAVPVQRNELINPIRATEPIQSGRGPPTAVKGVTQAKVVPLEFSMNATEEDFAAEEAAENQRKADIVAQNALPVWHTNSTVTGEKTRGGPEPEKPIPKIPRPAVPKVEEDDKKEGGDVLEEQLAEYYAQIISEKQKEAREDAEGDDSSAADEDDGFEDVGIATTAPSPSSSSSTVNEKPLPRPKKRRGSESGSSAPGTNMSTPAPSFLVQEYDDDVAPAAKRVKIAGMGNGVGSETRRLGGGGGNGNGNGERVSDEDADEDEAEFEDAL